MRHFSYLLARRIKNQNEDNLPIPIVVLLRNFTHAMHDLRYLITSLLVDELRLVANFATFLNLLKRGRVLLFLDGFDEMAMAVDEATRDHNFLMLQSLCVTGAKVVITGRPAYFPSDDHLLKLLSEDRALNPSVQVLLGNTRSLPTFATGTILPFNDGQISAFLRRCETFYPKDEFPGADKIAQRIRETYDLQSLASRPVLLDLIVKTLPRFIDGTYGVKATKHLTPADLYDLYTRYWLDREEEKGRKLIPKHIKRTFMCELAWTMFCRGTLRIHYSELPLEIVDYFQPTTDAQWEWYDHDIRTCSYLQRDERGFFSFAHKTFMEYFCAVRMVSDYVESRFDPLSATTLTPEVISFFADLAGPQVVEAVGDCVHACSESSVFWNNVMRFLTRKPIEEVAYVFVCCVAYFAPHESVAVQRVLRKVFEKATHEQRFAVNCALVDIEDRAQEKKIRRAVRIVAKHTELTGFIVDQYAARLRSVMDAPDSRHRLAALRARSSEVGILERYFDAFDRIVMSIERWGGFAKVREAEKGAGRMSEEEQQRISEETNASLRLVREMVEKYDIEMTELASALERLGLRKGVRRAASDATTESVRDMLARQFRISVGAVSEMLGKTNGDREQVVELLRWLEGRRRQEYRKQIEALSELPEEVLRTHFPLVMAAARRAGLLD